MGAYIAERFGNQAVFLASILLIAIDLAFIAMLLPESLGAGDDGEEVAVRGGGYEERIVGHGGAGGAPGGTVRIVSVMKRRANTLAHGDDFMAVQVCRTVSVYVEVSSLWVTTLYRTKNS